MSYTLVRELGRGGFGLVELVRDAAGAEFARKTLVVPHNIDSNDVRARFSREVKYQSAVVHENVVPIIASDLNADPPWFVMPKAHCSLLDELSSDRTLGSNPKKAIFDTLAGLEEIHRRGYKHRDFKPANVLKFVDPSGKISYALSDFGLMAVGEHDTSTITQSGMGGGTLGYQAPECALNFKRATVRSDIYSFGALLHDIFAPNPKRLPHSELTAPGKVGAVIERCTKKNSHRRYKNIEELREALFSALDVFEFEFGSDEEAQVVALLTRDTLPTEEEWDKIFDFLDEEEDNNAACGNVYRALRIDHIQQIADEQSGLLEGIANQFATFCRRGTFNFDYCDVLASKAQVFYDLGDDDVKAAICIALLQLGTGHNRWFVERKFMKMAGQDIGDELADRIAVELGVLEVDFKHEFEHLEGSINANKSSLHKTLQGLLAE